MGINTLFNVGAYKVNRQEVNPALVRTMANSAPNIQVKNNISSEAWQELADRVESNDCISSQDLRQLQDVGRACFKRHSELHKALAKSGYQDEAIRAELADIHVFRAGSDQIRESIGLSQAKLAVEAAAGASFGPTGLVTAYAAYSDLQKRNLEPLMDNIQGLRDGTSPNLYQGNEVQGFHGEEVWKQMNTMLDGAIAQAKEGNPQEVDAQYYELTNPEILGKLAQAAEAGCKVRVNVDPGRLSAFSGDHIVIDEVPDKLRALVQLAQVDGDMGVSLYPVDKELGNAKNLMHRKGLRVGDTFLLSGMNANAGSGENIDAGYTIEGPAAKRLVSNFQRDVNNSLGANRQEIFGEKPLAEFMKGDINMGTRGLISMFDFLSGPSPAGTEMPKASSAEELAEIARSKGQALSDYTNCTFAEIDALLAKGQAIPLSKYGKERFLEIMERTLEVTNSKENIERLRDIDLPKGDPRGTTAVALADLPNDRRATMIQAIQDAEEFVYVPAFVMTKSVAAVLVAKRDEMAAQGKDIDIRVVADSGIYPDGGTPNMLGVKYLEDHGIDVRWTLLPRSSSHPSCVAGAITSYVACFSMFLCLYWKFNSGCAGVMYCGVSDSSFTHNIIANVGLVQNNVGVIMRRVSDVSITKNQVLASSTDFNPGSCPSGDMKFMMALAMIKMRLTPETVLNAATLNGAFAMGVASGYGSITPGKKASLFITKKIPSYEFVPYSFTSQLIETTILNGKKY